MMLVPHIVCVKAYSHERMNVIPPLVDGDDGLHFLRDLVDLPNKYYLLSLSSFMNFKTVARRNDERCSCMRKDGWDHVWQPDRNRVPILTEGREVPHSIEYSRGCRHKISGFMRYSNQHHERACSWYTSAGHVPLNVRVMVLGMITCSEQRYVLA